MSRSLGRPYWALWSATAASSLGDGVRLTALPLLAAALTRDAVVVAGLTVATTAPWLLFGLVAGGLVDRVDRRRVLVFVNALRAAALALLAFVVFVDAASLPLLYAVSFALGTAETFVDSAVPTLVPSVVPRDRLDDANGRLAVAQTVNNEFAGPPLGGFLYGVAATAAFVVNAAAFALAAFLAALVRGSFRPSEPTGQPLRGAIAEGLRWLWRQRLLRTLGAMVAVLTLVDTAWYSIFVLYALEVLGASGVTFGILLAAGAVGSVTGGVIAGRVSRKLGAGSTLLAAVLVAALAQLAIGLTSSVVLAGAMLAAGGLTFTVWNVLTLSLRQTLVPDELLGRINSAYLFLGFGAMPLGALLGGVVANAFGLRAPFLLGAPLLVAAALAARPVLSNQSIALAQARAATD